ncbi:hypothetical protein [Oscillibacter sp. GMB15532]|uniref:hypothetical protein n=1 Tax=Oscillibacter sp. GMB15532 TaxID=3230022 RepID=UPI0034DF1962
MGKTGCGMTYAMLRTVLGRVDRQVLSGSGVFSAFGTYDKVIAKALRSPGTSGLNALPFFPTPQNRARIHSAPALFIRHSLSWTAPPLFSVWETVKRLGCRS